MAAFPHWRFPTLEYLSKKKKETINILQELTFRHSGYNRTLKYQIWQILYRQWEFRLADGAITNGSWFWPNFRVVSSWYKAAKRNLTVNSSKSWRLLPIRIGFSAMWKHVLAKCDLEPNESNLFILPFGSIWFCKWSEVGNNSASFQEFPNGNLVSAFSEF